MVSICGFILALILSPAERQPLLDAFVRRQQETQTYQADLKQTLRLRGLQKPVESTGKILYKSPNNMRMGFTQPAGEYMLLAGDDLYLKKANRAVIHRKSAGENARMLLELFRGGAKDWEEKFDISYAREDDRFIVTLRPRQADAKMHGVEIENVIALPSYDLRSIQIRFDKDNSMTYEFTDPVRNAPLDDKLFEVSGFDRKL